MTCKSGTGEDADDFGADRRQSMFEGAGEDPVHCPVVHGESASNIRLMIQRKDDR